MVHTEWLLDVMLYSVHTGEKGFQEAISRNWEGQKNQTLCIVYGPPRGGRGGYFPGAPKFLSGPIRILFLYWLHLHAVSLSLAFHCIVWTQ